MLVFNSTPSGSKLVGAHNRMGMKLASKFMASPTNTQKDSMKSHGFCINEFAEVCMLRLCRLQLLSRPRALRVLDFNQLHMSQVSTQLVRLFHAVSYAGPLWVQPRSLDTVPYLLRNTFKIRAMYGGFVHEHDLRKMPHALIWLSKVYGIPAGMYAYACQVWGTEYLREGSEFKSELQRRHA
eukprot:1144321-Pelagomonas_calceolata.AAC.1